MLCKTYYEVLQFLGTEKVQANCLATAITEVLGSLSWVRQSKYCYCVTIFPYDGMMFHFSEVCQTKDCGTGGSITTTV